MNIGDYMKKTKIIATVGPAIDTKEKLQEIIVSGVNVIRINLSHATHEFAEEIVKNVRKINKELNTNVGILIDTQGPEIRVGTFPEGYIELFKGDIITLTNRSCFGEDKTIHITYRDLHEDTLVGDRMLLDEGRIELNIIEKKGADIICEVLNNGKLFNNKSLNIPNIDLNVDFLSTDDKHDINFAHSLNADFIALSFVRSANDILDVNDILIGLKNEHMQIIAKIENRSAIDDIENIVKISDGIMVARGDLGVEIDLEEVPAVQKKIVKLACEKNKICIVATEMLSSMENKPRPTRAEVSDVANAVLDGVDAVMLSGETAVGKYPTESIIFMKRIIESTEREMDYNELINCYSKVKKEDITSTIAFSVVESANTLKTKAIVAATITGYTARKVSNYRPYCPIIATTPERSVATGLSLNWGVIPVVVEKFKSTDEIVNNSAEVAKEILNLEKSDKVVITGGFPVKKTKFTNFMKIEEIE